MLRAPKFETLIYSLEFSRCIPSRTQLNHLMKTWSHHWGRYHPMNLHHTKPGWFGCSWGAASGFCPRECMMDVWWMKGLAVHQSKDRRFIFSKWIRSRVVHFFLWPLFRWKWWVEIIHPYLSEFHALFFWMETGFASQNWAVGTGGFHVFFFCTKLKRFPWFESSCVEFVSERQGSFGKFHPRPCWCFQK